jgi:hypothetical protein
LPAIKASGFGGTLSDFATLAGSHNPKMTAKSLNYPAKLPELLFFLNS